MDRKKWSRKSYLILQVLPAEDWHSVWAQEETKGVFILVSWQADFMALVEESRLFYEGDRLIRTEVLGRNVVSISNDEGRGLFEPDSACTNFAGNIRAGQSLVGCTAHLDWETISRLKKEFVTYPREEAV